MWTQLLWKDTRQVLPSVSICLGLVVAGQLFPLLVKLKTTPYTYDIAGSLAFVAPILVALACAGMSIGNERQSRTMQWLSSLPVPWHRTFLSQLFVALVCISVTFLITWLLAWMLPDTTHYQPIFQSRPEFSWCLLLVAELFVFSILFLLLVDEPLYGLAAAGFTTAVVNLSISYLWIENSNSLAFRVYSDVFDSVMLGAIVIFSALIVCSMVFAYRWRWSFGQHVNLANFWRVFERLGIAPTARVGTALPTGANRPFRTLLSQSIHHAALFRLAMVSMPFVLTISFSKSINEIGGPLLAWSMLTAIILGVSCFASDHAKQRFRFLSERGIASWKFYWARTIPPLALALLLIGIALAILNLNDQVSQVERVEVNVLTLSSSLGLFFLAQLACLCFRNAVIAIGATLAVGFGAGMFVGTTVSLSNYSGIFWDRYWPHLNNSASLFLAVWVIFVAVLEIFWLVPIWMRWEQNQNRLRLGFLASAVLLPLALTVLIEIGAYWSIPTPIWPGQFLSRTELAELEPKKSMDVELTGPNQEAFVSTGLTKTLFIHGLLDNWSADQSIWQLKSDWRNVEFVRKARSEALESPNMDGVLHWLEELKTGLSESRSKLEQADDRSYFQIWHNRNKLQFWSLNCDGLLFLAIQTRNRELLDETIAAYETIVQFYPVMAPLSRIELHQSTLNMLSSCSDAELRWTMESQPLQSFLNEATTLGDYRRWAFERSKVLERYQSETNWVLNHEDALLFGRYRLDRSFCSDAPMRTLMGYPYALARRFHFSTYSREITAELDSLDRLIAAEENRETIVDELSVYQQARANRNLPSRNLRTEMLENRSTFLMQFLHYREFRRSLTKRVECIELQ